MLKDSILTMKLESGLRDDFVAEAAAVNQSASQIMRQLMRNYIDNQRKIRAYEGFVQHKIDLARVSVRDRLGRPDKDVRAEFQARRASVKVKR